MTPRTRLWSQLSRREQDERKVVYQLLVDEHDIHTSTAVAQLRADRLWHEAVHEIDPTDGFWHERVAQYIAERW